MDVIRVWFISVWRFYQLEVTVFGYTFTFWQIMIYGFVLIGVGILISALFSGGEH